MRDAHGCAHAGSQCQRNRLGAEANSACSDRMLRACHIALLARNYGRLGSNGQEDDVTRTLPRGVGQSDPRRSPARTFAFRNSVRAHAIIAPTNPWSSARRTEANQSRNTGRCAHASRTATVHRACPADPPASGSRRGHARARELLAGHERFA